MEERIQTRQGQRLISAAAMVGESRTMASVVIGERASGDGVPSGVEW